MRRLQALLIPLLAVACATAPPPTVASTVVCGSQVQLVRELQAGGKPALDALGVSVAESVATLEAGEPLSDEQLATLREVANAIRALGGCL